MTLSPAPVHAKRFSWLLVLALACFLAPMGAGAYELSFDRERLERSLRLNPIQQQQFDIAMNATQRAMLSIGLGVLQVKTALGRELLKDRPDPEALARAQQEMLDISRPHLRTARDEWLRFYSLLDDEQVAVARVYVEAALRGMERLAEDLSKRFLEGAQRP